MTRNKNPHRHRSVHLLHQDPLDLSHDNEDAFQRYLGLSFSLIVVTAAAFVLALTSELSLDYNWTNILGIFIMLVLISSIFGTYLGAGSLVFPTQWKFWQPLQGGIRFITLQIIGWSLFALSIGLTALPWILSFIYPMLAIRGLILSAAAAAVLSEISIAFSVLFYTPSSSSSSASPKRSSSFVQRLSSSMSTTEEEESDEKVDGQVESGGLLPGFMTVQVILSLTCVALAYVVDEFEFEHSGSLFFIAASSMSCAIVSLFMTHGIGGKLRHGHQWSFFQPLQGGIPFIILQAITWTMFATSIFLFLLHLDLFVDDTFSISLKILHWFQFTEESLPSLTVTSLLAASAEVISVLALYIFHPEHLPPISSYHHDQPHAVSTTRHHKKKKKQEYTKQSKHTSHQHENEPSSSNTRPVFTRVYRLIRFIFIIIFFNTEKVLISFFVSFMIWASKFPLTAVAALCLLVALYFPTFLGQPELTGRRRLKWLNGHWLIELAATYFNLKVVTEASNEDERQEFYGVENNRLIFGFHPHGIVPAFMMIVLSTKQWLYNLCNTQPPPLASSITHFVPILRDLVQLFGCVEVSRQGFSRALDEKSSAILIPGGQSEMIESRSESKEIILKTHHKGFLKFAMEVAAIRPNHKHYLVPMYSFGETQIFDNIRLPKSLQEFCTKTLKANVVYAPYGRWSLFGVPRPVQITVVVGKPIQVPPVIAPTPEQIEILRRRYYTHLHEIFEKHKKEAGHEDDKITFIPSIEPLRDDEFEQEFAKQPISEEDIKHPNWRHYSNHCEKLWMGILISTLFWTVVGIAWVHRLQM